MNAVRYNDGEKQCFDVGVKEHMTIDDLKKEIRKGHPVICFIQAWNMDENEEYSMDLDYSNEWECGHWVVAIGYNGDNIFFMDPSTAGDYTYIPSHKLVARWHAYILDENSLSMDCVQMGIAIKLCENKEADCERYGKAFYGLM